MTAIAPVTLATVVLVGSCGANAGAAFARVGEPGPDGAEGRVRLAGSRPFTRTIIETDEDGAITVTGPYAAEIGRLAGAVVRVTGYAGGADMPGPSIDASSYEVASVDGDPVKVGHLRSDEGGHYLESLGRRLPVGSVSEALAAREGALVWVVLDENGGVARYGVLRDPPSPGAGPS